MQVLLLGVAGTLFGPVVAASLTREGATVFCGHTVETPPLPSRHYAAHLLHPGFEQAGAFERFMLDHASSHRDVVLLPGVDAAVAAIQPIRHQLDALMPVAAAPPEATAIALDKARTMEAAAAITDGLAAPPTIVPKDADDAVDRWSGPWPAVVKPRTGTGSEGVRLARDRGELRDTYTLVANSYDRPLVQMAVQFDPRSMFALYYLFDGSGRLRSWYMQRADVRGAGIGIGTTSEQANGGRWLLWRSDYDLGRLERGRRVMEAIGWRGIGVIEGAVDQRDGKSYVFEINPRAGGTSTHFLKQDINLVHDACLVALGRVPPERLRYRIGVRAKVIPFQLVATRRSAIALSALDPTRVGSMPGLSDPLPILELTRRFLTQAMRSRH